MPRRPWQRLRDARCLVLNQQVRLFQVQGKPPQPPRARRPCFWRIGSADGTRIKLSGNSPSGYTIAVTMPSQSRCGALNFGVPPGRFI